MVVAVIPAAYDALSSTVNVLVARRTVQYVRCCRAIRRCGIVRRTAEPSGKCFGLFTDLACRLSAWEALAMSGVGILTEGPVWGLGGADRLTDLSDLHIKGETHLGTSKDVGLRISLRRPFESRQSWYQAALPLAGEACIVPMRPWDYG